MRTVRGMVGRRSGGSLTDLRRANRHEALTTLRLNGPLTQAEISRATGLSHASVSNIVRELTSQGLARTSEVHRNGRKVAEVSLEPSTGLVGGIDFGNRHIRAAVADFTHTVRGEAYVTLAYGHEAAVSVSEAARVFRELLANAGAHISDVQVLAVGVPGPTNRDSGRTLSSAILPGWAGFNVTAAFEEALGVRTTVDNDANLGALAEGLWGVGRGFSDFAYVKVSTGIGAGLVLNGQLYRGVAGSAGEIGHTTIEEDGPLCRCGNRGCLEVFAASPALLELLRRSYPDDFTVTDLLRLSEEGDVGCRRVLTDAGRHIGVALANLCNLLSPQLIIVGGELAGAGEVLLSAIRESIARRTMALPAHAPKITTGAFSERAGVLGALALALQEGDSVAPYGARDQLVSTDRASAHQISLAG
ncbi:MAG: ROK family transcriptional regulator [Candidatus Dormibacteraeota bacterium]|uniref:Transcriptional regulator n=1 Tax=Candidatus Aeolococcus gillhamiae TaxID=3127015 RepID=A0A2W6AA42_9BACT|nr:ROK family transcriptional regulator [Candidatus Dormibacteraeota bacterium]PZR82198.1 MAG: transcriptional regulator [Candidatus Dormibacter sp. RRmetagenome_bin12]